MRDPVSYTEPFTLTQWGVFVDLGTHVSFICATVASEEVALQEAAKYFKETKPTPENIAHWNGRTPDDFFVMERTVTYDLWRKA